MTVIAERNEKGEVTMGDIAVTIPTDRSMLSIFGANPEIINGSDYRDDGWVYLNGEKIKKWHSRYDRITIWEPRFKDLYKLYELWVSTKKASAVAWGKVYDIVQLVYKNGGTAHANPTHEYTGEKQWWMYKIEQSDYPGYTGLSYSWNWVDNPTKLVNSNLGQIMYEREQYWHKTACNRSYKARTIFYAALMRALPKAERGKAHCFKFNEHTFWFHTYQAQYGYVWKMLEDDYEITTQEVTK